MNVTMLPGCSLFLVPELCISDEFVLSIDAIDVAECSILQLFFFLNFIPRFQIIDMYFEKLYFK